MKIKTLGYATPFSLDKPSYLLEADATEHGNIPPSLTLPTRLSSSQAQGGREGVGVDKRCFRIHLFPLVLILILIVIGWVFEGAAHKIYAASPDQEIETTYNQIREAFFALDKSPQKKQRQPWQLLIEGFRDIYKQHPQTPWGEKSMFMVGRVSYALFKWSGMEPDLDLALDHFSRFVNHYPQSSLADDALYLAAEIYFLHKKNLEKARQTALTLIKEYPKGDMKGRAEELLTTIDKSGLLSEADKTDLFKEDSIEKNKVPEGTERPKKPLPQVTGLRHWSNPLYKTKARAKS